MDVEIKASKEGELVIARKDEDGVKYLVADTAGCISFMHIGNQPGLYHSKHASAVTTVAELVKMFIG